MLFSIDPETVFGPYERKNLYFFALDYCIGWGAIRHVPGPNLPDHLYHRRDSVDGAKPGNGLVDGERPSQRLGCGSEYASLTPVFITIFGLLFYQVNLLAEDWPRIKEQTTSLFNQAQSYIAARTGLTPEQQTQKAQQIAKSLSSALTSFFGTFTSTITNFILVFVYVVLMLSHRHRFERFFLKTVESSDKKHLKDTLYKVRKSASSYVWGMLKVIMALAVFYSLGFWLGGIKYSILLAVLAALFSFLPYVGNVIGGGMAALLAVVSGEPSGFFVVVGVMTLAQVLENYFLSPMIVGDEVELNPFFSIVSVIVFGALWGIGGAIVAIPLAAIVHIILKFSPDTLPLAELMETGKGSEK